MSVYENIYEKHKNEAKEKVISISNSARQSSNISNKRKKWKKKKKTPLTTTYRQHHKTRLCGTMQCLEKKK